MAWNENRRKKSDNNKNTLRECRYTKRALEKEKRKSKNSPFSNILNLLAKKGKLTIVMLRKDMLDLFSQWTVKS